MVRSAIGYRSGRRVARGTPVTRSTSTTCSAGTRFHCAAAALLRPRASDSRTTPPAASIAANRPGSRSLTDWELRMFVEYSPTTPTSQASLHHEQRCIGYFLPMGMGQRIKLARKGRMTQAALGNALPTVVTGFAPPEPVTKGAVSQWENEETIPTLPAAAATAMLLGRSLDHLVFGRSRTFEARIDALPPGFRDEVLKSVLGAIESAESAARALPDVAGSTRTDSNKQLKKYAGAKRPTRPTAKKRPATRKAPAPETQPRKRAP